MIIFDSGAYGGKAQNCEGKDTKLLSSWRRQQTIFKNDPNLPVVDVMAMADWTHVIFADESSQFVRRRTGKFVSRVLPMDFVTRKMK